MTWKLESKAHWLLPCSKYSLPCNAKKHLHKPESAIENNECKILQDLIIQTNKVLEYRQSDIVKLDKMLKECRITNFSVPGI